jgi:nucleotide-binding universal stress UspA family protein
MTETTKTTENVAMTNILVPLDGSEEARAALPYAMALATPGTEILLLTVVPAEAGVAAAQAALEPVARRLRTAGHAVQTEIAVGDPAERILDTAARSGAGMIVMASHGRGAVGRLIYGSVADRVAREATVPTMVVRTKSVPPGPVAITRLVVPLDGSPLAEASLPVAAAISTKLGTPLFLIRAINPVELLPPAVGIGGAMPPEIYAETEEQMEQDARDYLERTAQSLRDQGLPVATEVLVGPPAAAIVGATHLGDVVVLVSHERTGVMRWLLGSVSETLTREDQAPIILAPKSMPAQGAD